jgi:hypothetical protein
MAILTDDQDIRMVYLQTLHGGNGDYYIVLKQFDKEGKYMGTMDYRCAMSGGNAPTEVKLAVATLYRAMEAAGLNNHPKDD